MSARGLRPLSQRYTLRSLEKKGASTRPSSAINSGRSTKEIIWPGDWARCQLSNLSRDRGFGRSCGLGPASLLAGFKRGDDRNPPESNLITWLLPFCERAARAREPFFRNRTACRFRPASHRFAELARNFLAEQIDPPSSAPRQDISWLEGSKPPLHLDRRG